MYSDARRRDLPPDNEREVWISDVAATIRRALDQPQVRAEIVSLLSGDEERRSRRLAALATKLAGRELTMRLRDGNDDA